MVKFRRAKESDLPSWLKCLRRVDEELLSRGIDMWDKGYPSAADFLKDLENECLYVLVEGERVLASCSVSHSLSSFFPETQSQAKQEQLLEDIGYEGNPLTLLHRFFVDPSYRHQGLGKELFQALEAKYKGNDFLVDVYEKNEGVRGFYFALGFVEIGKYEFEYGEYASQYLLYKRYLEPGLCRYIAW